MNLSRQDHLGQRWISDIHDEVFSVDEFKLASRIVISSRNGTDCLGLWSLVIDV